MASPENEPGLIAEAQVQKLTTTSTEAQSNTPDEPLDGHDCFICEKPATWKSPLGDYWGCEDCRGDLEYNLEYYLTPQPLDPEVEQELTRLRTRDKARRLFNTENRPQVEPPEILTLRELLARPQPEITYRIEGLQPADTRVMFSAQYKAGKTTVRDNVTRALVDGDLFLGKFEVNTVDRVVILDFEMGGNQLAAWLADQGIEADDRVTVIPMRGKASTFDLLDEATLSEWAQRLAKFDYLILDPLRPILDALGLDEHRDGGRFLTAFDELCHEAGIPDSLIIHHMGHTAERARGDSRFRDWPDVEWQLVREDKEDPASPRYIKAYGRDVDFPESLLTYDETTRHLTVAGGNRKDAKAREAIPDILKLLENAEKPMSIRQIVEASGEGLTAPAHSRESIRRALRLRGPDGALNGAVKVTKGPRNATLFELTAPVRGSAPTEPRRSQLSAPVPIGTGALNTRSGEEAGGIDKPDPNQPVLDAFSVTETTDTTGSEEDDYSTPGVLRRR